MTGTLDGKVVGVTFSNESTSFYILKVQTKEKTESVRGTFLGPKIQVGVSGKFTGKYEEHSKYGVQFSATDFEMLREKSRQGVISYLTNYVPSIGNVTAGKLYAHFGDDLLEMLEKNQERIHEATFLTQLQRESILAEWSIASGSRTLTVYLISLGLNSTQIKGVLTHFGVEQTEERLRENPYLLTQCAGIGFPTADSIAIGSGVKPESPLRLQSMVLFVMRELANSEGHVWVTSRQIRSFISDRLFRKFNVNQFASGSTIPDSLYYKTIASLEQDGAVHCRGDHIYLKSDWEKESECSQLLLERISETPYEFKDIPGFLRDFQERKKLVLAPEQLQAIEALSKSRLVVISGYPGTGKTLVTSAIVELFEKHNITYNLLSPTGIAAKRMSQVTGRTASTIHRALGAQRDGTWMFNETNPFIVDAVVVDESSMVDLTVFYRLVSALRPETILVMVGDAAQLPSVRNGDVLRSLQKSSSVPFVQLENIYRQDKASDIIKIAHQMLRGDSIDTTHRKESEVIFFNLHDDDVVGELKKMSSLLKSKEANFQIMAPVYDGLLGVNNLNIELRSVLNPGYDSDLKIKAGDVDFHEGDRVMATKNNYEKMLFNGDTGKVQKINVRAGEVEVKIFDWYDQEATVSKYHDVTFTFKIEEFRNMFRVAYAVTVHRTQGNEFDYVILPMTRQYRGMLYRNLMYTALTRAKKKVFIFGDPGAFQLASANERDISRNTSLHELIDIPPAA